MKSPNVSLLISPFYNFIVKTAFFIIHLWVLETSLISFYLRMRKKMILKRNVCPVDTFDFITCVSPQITLGFVINIIYCLGVFDTWKCIHICSFVLSGDVPVRKISYNERNMDVMVFC